MTIKKIILNHITSELEQITVIPGKCRMNDRCHMNSVHEAKKNGDKKLALVWCVNKKTKDIMIHFINYTNRKFVDNTLGEWSTQGNFYFVKWVRDEEMWDIEKIFSRYRETVKLKLPWYQRIFINPHVTF